MVMSIVFAFRARELWKFHTGLLTTYTNYIELQWPAQYLKKGVKAGQHRLIPLHQGQTKKILASWSLFKQAPTTIILYPELLSWVKLHFQDSDGSKCTLQSLRHVGAYYALRDIRTDEAGIEVVRKQLGHKSIQSTELYLDVYDPGISLKQLVQLALLFLKLT